MALHCGLRYSEKIAGVIALSAFYLHDKVLAKDKLQTNVPVFMAHGDYDEVVPLSWAKRSKDLLIAADQNVEWLTYPMEHMVCLEEVRAVSAWMQKILIK